jgi:hypothetical protein
MQTSGIRWLAGGSSLFRKRTVFLSFQLPYSPLAPESELTIAMPVVVRAFFALPTGVVDARDAAMWTSLEASGGWRPSGIVESDEHIVGADGGAPRFR